MTQPSSDLRPSQFAASARWLLQVEDFRHARFHVFIHFNKRRPEAFKTFAGEFLRRVNAHFAAAGDFARRVVENIGRAFGESLRTATMLSRCGSVWALRRKRTSLVLRTSTSASTTMIYLAKTSYGFTSVADSDTRQRFAFRGRPGSGRACRRRRDRRP